MEFDLKWYIKRINKYIFFHIRSSFLKDRKRNNVLNSIIAKI